MVSLDLESLVTQLSSDDKHVRRRAIEQLRSLLPDVRGHMLDAISSSEWKVRASAAAVLDHAEQDEAVERALRKAARDPDARVRDAAFHSLSCVHCKPEGCVAGESIDVLVHGLLHDPSVRVRRKIAGDLMWQQHGTPPSVVAAFRLLLRDDDRVLRDRAAAFLASVEVPRADVPYREWLPAWQACKAELLVSPPYGPSSPACDAPSLRRRRPRCGC
ncbi:MAG TPA: hypothetical protein VK461_16740 [Acidimicrobiales bacterium]|nr:hypothetical protein [Acidimicrobiales bacterium]